MPLKYIFSPFNLQVMNFRNNSLWLCLPLVLILAPPLLGQGNKDGFLWRYVNSIINDTTDESEPRLLIYPTVAYAPETSWEVGFSTLYVYYANKDIENRLSEISGFTFYTFENQYGIWFDHALYTDQDKWFFLGRSRFQSFPLLYYGIGPDSPSDYLAEVDGNYLLLRERVLRELAHSVYFGLQVDYQNLFDVEFKSVENSVTIPRGGEGSANLGLGFSLVYDNRHNVLNVRDGFFSEQAFLRYDDAWGSDFTFSNIISDNRLFVPVNERDVLAAQLFGQFTFNGNAPFNQLALMGGESLMRGYYLGRYRDDNLIAGQVEYRLLPFKFAKRFGASAFISAGQVFGSGRGFEVHELLPAGGLGGRFLLFPKKDIWVRLDMAFTEEGSGFYFFIGEAF